MERQVGSDQNGAGHNDMRQNDAGQNDAGRAVVRRLFVDPILGAGLKRPKGISAAAFEKGLDRAVGLLDHMGADNLTTLAEYVINYAARSVGAAQGCWPAFVAIEGWAHGMQPRPFRMSRIVTSWLVSIEGPVAVAGGYAVPLLRFLRRMQRPPTTYDMAAIKEQARDDLRRLSLIHERIQRGTAQQADRDWHSAYLSDQAQAAAFVGQGIAARAEHDTTGHNTAGHDTSDQDQSERGVAA